MPWLAIVSTRICHYHCHTGAKSDCQDHEFPAVACQVEPASADPAVQLQARRKVGVNDFTSSSSFYANEGHLTAQCVTEPEGLDRELVLFRYLLKNLLQALV